MPTLVHISKSNCKTGFPSLEYLEIDRGDLPINPTRIFDYLPKKDRQLYRFQFRNLKYIKFYNNLELYEALSFMGILVPSKTQFEKHLSPKGAPFDYGAPITSKSSYFRMHFS